MSDYSVISTATPRANRRAKGFTLIELLTVIGIIATMITVLLPAIFKAKQDVEVKLCKEIVNRLAFACKSYAKDFEDIPPAVVDNPVSLGYTECQNLRLALVGFSADSFDQSGNPSNVKPRNQGSAIDPTNYFSSTRHTYIKFKPDEFGPNPDSSTDAVEIFLDTTFKPTRPILYYRKHIDGSWPDCNGAYFQSKYQDAPSTVNDVGNANSYVGLADRAGERFVLVWAGLNRKFDGPGPSPKLPKAVGDDFSSLDY